MTNKKLTAIWDFSKADNRIGSFIIFQEEILLYCRINQIFSVNMLFISSGQINSQSIWTGMANLNPLIESMSFLDILPNDKMDEEYRWPPEGLFQDYSYSGSTLTVQQLFLKTGKMINLVSPDSHIREARTWLDSHLDNRIPVAVHLKANETDTQSNANQHAWKQFFLYCLKEKTPVKFVLIGIDNIEEEIKNLENTIVTKEHDGDFNLDMAIIQLSLFFMGMSSGPCNLALMSARPYLIWKHPQHHSDQMEKEFQGGNGFGFSTENQKFFRDWDSCENLTKQFYELFNKLQPNWRKRI